MKSNDITEIENIIGYEFQNKYLLQQAFTQKNFGDYEKDCPKDCNY